MVMLESLQRGPHRLVGKAIKMKPCLNRNPRISVGMIGYLLGNGYGLSPGEKQDKRQVAGVEE